MTYIIPSVSCTSMSKFLEEFLPGQLQFLLKVLDFILGTFKHNFAKGLMLGNLLFDRKLNSLAQRPQSGNLL